jgi:hypothetical protein
VNFTSPKSPSLKNEAHSLTRAQKNQAQPASKKYIPCEANFLAYKQRDLPVDLNK